LIKISNKWFCFWDLEVLLGMMEEGNEAASIEGGISILGQGKGK
jgi:hypothetical protein